MPGQVCLALRAILTFQSGVLSFKIKTEVKMRSVLCVTPIAILAMMVFGEPHQEPNAGNDQHAQEKKETINNREFSNAVSEGFRAFEEGDMKRYLLHIERYVLQYPDDAGLYFYYADALFRNNRTRDGYEFLERVKDKDPNREYNDPLRCALMLKLNKSDEETLIAGVGGVFDWYKVRNPKINLPYPPTGKSAEACAWISCALSLEGRHDVRAMYLSLARETDPTHPLVAMVASRILINYGHNVRAMEVLKAAEPRAKGEILEGLKIRMRNLKFVDSRLPDSEKFLGGWDKAPTKVKAKTR